VDKEVLTNNQTICKSSRSLTYTFGALVDDKETDASENIIKTNVSST